MAAKDPKEMSLIECLEALVRYEEEHDLDCEEGIGSDRCPPCLAAAALEKVTQDGEG